MTSADVAVPAEEAGARAPFQRVLGWLYLIGGLIGLAAAFVIMIEKLEKLENPDYVPSCSLNPVVSCGSVMDSDQASAFGFPNPLIGIAAFAVVAAVGVVLLTGYRAPRWFWLGMQAGVTFGVVFVHWLIHASLYDIKALCPYCMVVWAVTIPIFWYTTLYNLLSWSRLPAGVRRVVEGAARLHTMVVALWFAAIAGLILGAFWDYWSGLF